MTSLEYIYCKKRHNFGRQPFFCMAEAMIDSIEPNLQEQQLYCLRNPVNREVQVYDPKSEHDVNTFKVDYKRQSVNHAEGGWPKDLQYQNEEETSRYRRRIERDENYVHAIMKLAPKFEHSIMQNNAIDIYEYYFKDMQETLPLGKPSAKLVNVFRDPDKRPVSCLCWTNEDNPKLVVAHCSKEYSVTRPVNKNFTCHIWQLDNSDEPSSELLPPAACWQLACSPADPALIIGGLDDGTVCVFDIRADKEPIAISLPFWAHKDPVSALIYMQSRLNNEFFSGSSDGQCKWYDLRNISKPIDTLIISVNIRAGGIPTLSNSESVSALQFERSFPTRFMCGTDTGLVINVNRKGKSYEDIMSAVYNAHKGPVRAVERSTCSTKIFLTCGDWTTHIWSDDIKSTPIITGMPHRYQLMDAVWAPQRHSAYMTVSSDGTFRFWDLLRHYHKPVISLPVSKFPLLNIAPQEEGYFIAMGDKLGTVFLLALSEDLVISADKDKYMMQQIYERECHRERILEARVKEIRLKLKLDEEEMTMQTEEVFEEADQLKTAEDKYRKQVIEEIRRLGVPQSSPLFDTIRVR